MAIETEQKFMVLCYHYVRSLKTRGLFPRILGNSENDFIDQIKKLKKLYQVISPNDVLDFYYSGKKHIKKNQVGLLFTLDDGLSDHYLAAKILHNFGIKALFFIPTCVTEECLPANPTIVHYCLAKYGIASFLNSLKEAAKKFNIVVSVPTYNRGDNVWEKIKEIKRTLKYDIAAAGSRKILLDIYVNTFYRDHENAFEIMHLTQAQIKEMIAMGHSIGAHTHSHLSVASSALSAVEIEQEILNPRLLLEKRFEIKVNTLSYPFGEPADCLVAQDLLKITSNYNLAFTVEEKINTAGTSPLQLGRYMPTSKDTVSSVLKNLAQISGAEH